MSLLAPASVADDRVPAADRTSAWQLRQADQLPWLGLVIRRRQCDKENHGWREGLPLVSPPSSIRRLAFTLLYGQCRTKKE